MDETTASGPFEHADPRPSEPAPGWRPGDEIGTYTLVREAGRGGMGVVWLARDRVLQRDVAIKTFPSDLAANRVAMDAFLTGARRVAALQHTHLNRLHAAGEHCGVPYLIMDFLGGGTLADHASSDGRCGTEQTIRIGAQIASAIDALHRHGLLHRDIKPPNVLLDHEGRPIVTDFGLVCDVDTASQRGPTWAAGTPAFMAPEMGSDGASVRTDVFALGLTLHQIWDGGVEDDDRSDSLREIIARATRTDPVYRTRSAARVEAALEGLMREGAGREQRDVRTQDGGAASAGTLDQLAESRRQERTNTPARQASDTRARAEPILGVCGACGHAVDIQATPERCPECRSRQVLRSLKNVVSRGALARHRARLHRMVGTGTLLGLVLLGYTAASVLQMVFWWLASVGLDVFRYLAAVVGPVCMLFMAVVAVGVASQIRSLCELPHRSVPVLAARAGMRASERAAQWSFCLLGVAMLVHIALVVLLTLIDFGASSLELDPTLVGLNPFVLAWWLTSAVACLLLCVGVAELTRLVELASVFAGTPATRRDWFISWRNIRLWSGRLTRARRGSTAEKLWAFLSIPIAIVVCTIAAPITLAILGIQLMMLG